VADSNPTPVSRTGLTRRGMLTAGGAAIIGVAGGFALGRGTEGDIAPGATAPAPTPEATLAAADLPSSAGDVIPLDTRTPFYGEHQAGIETRAALLQTFVGLNLRIPSSETALAVLRLITDDASRLTQGEPALGDMEPELAATPAGLTITVGLGRPFFTRTGIADRIPAQLVEIPPFATDQLQDRWGQTDLLLQIGADDAVTLTHAVRMLTKDLSTLTKVEWTQPGFRSAASAVAGTQTTRNLMSQVDGTVNPQPGSPQFDEVVWIPDGPAWVAGGTVLVLRRIRMLLDTWDILDRETQENVIGRKLDSGAPLGREKESDPVPFDEADDRGLPLIPADSHIRVAHAATNREMILRRPYSYDNGMQGGTNDMGLLFAAYTSDPAASFIPMQERIASSDAFNEWNVTVGSAAYFIPSGVEIGEIIGEGIFT